MEAHVEHLEKVLGLLKESNVTLKLKKCSFFNSKVVHLFHTIIPGKLAEEIENSWEIHQALFPNDKTKIRSFLGAYNVYRRFVEWFLKRSRPLNEMLKKNSEPDWGNPTP